MDETTKNKYLKDIDYFSKRLEEDPGSKVFMPLAMAYLKLGKYDEVIEICSKGLDSNPDYIAPKTVLAQAYLGKGMINEAKGLLVEVAAVNKDNYKANKLLGDIYRSEGNIENAVKHYRTALMISPEDVQLRELVNELAETSEAELSGDELQSEDIKFESDEDIAKLADELFEEFGEIDRKNGDDFLLIAGEIDRLIEQNEYKKAKEYAREHIKSADILEKKLKEIEAYEQKDSITEEDLEVEIPDELSGEENALVSDDDIAKLLAEGDNEEAESTNTVDEEDFSESPVVKKLFGEDSESDLSGEMSQDHNVENNEITEGIPEKSSAAQTDQDFIYEDDQFTEDIDSKRVEESEQIQTNDKQEVVEMLEKWLENIRKVKKGRKV